MTTGGRDNIVKVYATGALDILTRGSHGVDDAWDGSREPDLPSLELPSTWGIGLTNGGRENCGLPALLCFGFGDGLTPASLLSE